jgi:Flp pilus assembly protein TadG
MLLKSKGGKWWRRDTGNAAIEFIVVGVGIIAPLVYIAITVMTLHAASFAAHAAAREAARVFMSSQTIADGNRTAVSAMQQAFTDHGVHTTPKITVTCSNGPCLGPGSLLNIDIASYVPLPFVPRWGESAPLALPVAASITVLVDKYRQAG